MPACTEHPEFPQPDEPTATLWRYMDWMKFEQLVSTSRIVMPSADRLGDHREGTIAKGQSDWWDTQIANATSDEQRATLLHNRDFIGEMAQAFRDHYYVSCWHRNEHENSAMWSCYTTTPKSVAIQTQYDLLVDALPTYAFVGNVRYMDYSLIRQSSMNMLEMIMHKDVCFNFEQETRAVVFAPTAEHEEIAHFRDNHFTLEGDGSFRCTAPTVRLARLIKAVVLHPKASMEFSERVAELCAKNGLPAPTASKIKQSSTI